MVVHNTVQELVTKTIPKKKKFNSGKPLSVEALQIHIYVMYKGCFNSNYFFIFLFLIASKNKGLSDLCVCVCVYIQLLVTPGTVAC